MRCPKCKAKIGIERYKVASESGLSAGKICYICGYWIQEYPQKD